MSTIKIASTKWYGRWWPPERRKIRVMQAIVDYYEKELLAKTNQAVRDYYIYGIVPEGMRDDQPNR